MLTRGFLLTALLSSAVTAQAIEVRLRSSIATSAPIVRLADIAEINAADGEDTAWVANVMVCAAPSRSQDRTFTQQQVRQLLALSDVEMSRILVTGSEQVVIHGGEETQLPVKRQLTARPVKTASFVEPSPAPSGAVAKPAAVESSIDRSSATAGVQRGAAVSVHSNRPGIRIVTSGKALQAGQPGETISIELADSREKTWARVVGPKTVEIASASTANP